MASELRVDKIIPTGGVPTGGGGGIIQVVFFSLATGSTVTVNSSSFVDVLTASITPKFNTSKILVQVTSAPKTNGSSSNFQFGALIQRNSTTIMYDNEYLQMNNGYAPNAFTGAYTVLDSPASSSSLTYKFRVKETVDGRELYFENSTDNTGNYYNKHTMTLMEISG